MADFSMTALERVKNLLRIPADDLRQDGLLRRCFEDASLAVDHWAGRHFRRRRYLEHIAAARARERLPNVLILVGTALSSALQGLKVLQDKGEIAKLENWLDAEGGQTLQADPTCCLIWTRELACLEAEGVSCNPRASWIVSLADEQPVLQREVLLVFVGKGRRLDVVLYPSSRDSRRVTLPKNARKRLEPYARKRLYLPSGINSEAEVNLAVRDHLALLCLYLAQRKLIDPWEKKEVRGFLLEYLSGFRYVRWLGTEWVLNYLLSHYLLPEDSRGWRKYIAKTVRGLRLEKHKEEQPQVVPGSVPPKGLTPIRDVTQFLGLSLRSVYHLARSGKVRPQLDESRRLAIVGPDLERMRKYYEEKQNRRVLIDYLVDARKISRHSARRWVQRQESKGLSFQQIAAAASPHLRSKAEELERKGLLPKGR